MAIGSALGLIGGAVIGGIASNKAADTQAAAAASATDAQLTAARENIEFQQGIYDDNVARFNPFYQVGLQDLERFRANNNAPTPQTSRRYEGFTNPRFNTEAVRYGPQANALDLSGFEASPGYEFRLQEGLDAVEASAAQRFGLTSGATAKAMNDYAQGMASQEFNNFAARQERENARTDIIEQGRFDADRGFVRSSFDADRGFAADQNALNRAYNTALDADDRAFNFQARENFLNRLGGVANMGQAAAGNLASQGNILGQNIAQTNSQAANAAAAGITNAANARAAGTVGTANALTNGLTQWAGIQQMNNLANPAASGGGWLKIGGPNSLFSGNSWG